MSKKRQADISEADSEGDHDEPDAKFEDRAEMLDAELLSFDKQDETPGE
jgi:hypothetical protein